MAAASSNLLRAVDFVTEISGYDYSVFSGLESLTLQGGLTSIYAAPTSCSATTTQNSIGSPNYLFIGFDFIALPESSYDSPCMPPMVTVDGFSAWINFSPGVCPSGWTTAISAGIETALTNDYSIWTLGSDITRARCCPSDYTLATADSSIGCVTVVNPGATITNYLASGSVLTTLIVKTAMTVHAQNIGVMWQSTDTEILALLGSPITQKSSSTRTQSTGSQSSSLILSVSSSSISSISSPSVTPSASSGGSSSLSSGAKAGIAIGVILIVAIGAFIAFCILRRKKKKGAAVRGGRAGAELETSANKHELQTSANITELPLNANRFPSHKLVSELQSEQNISSELASSQSRAELQAKEATPELCTEASHSSSSARPAADAKSKTEFLASNSAQTEESYLPPQLSRQSDPSEPSRLDLLRKRIDLVREEKERITKLQELNDLEEELKNEIMMEQRREMSI